MAMFVSVETECIVFPAAAPLAGGGGPAAGRIWDIQAAATTSVAWAVI